jgi:hypothetical protein
MIKKVIGLGGYRLFYHLKYKSIKTPLLKAAASNLRLTFRPGLIACKRLAVR